MRLALKATPQDPRQLDPTWKTILECVTLEIFEARS